MESNLSLYLRGRILALEPRPEQLTKQILDLADSISGEDLLEPWADEWSYWILGRICEVLEELHPELAAADAFEHAAGVVKAREALIARLEGVHS
jgi:hypothetical protein